MLQKMVFLICLILSHAAFAKNIALSFDDGLDPSLNTDAHDINHAILSTLKQHKIHAIVYPSLSKIGSSAGLDLISEWGKQGHRIGNHGNLHLNLNKAEVKLNDYLQDIEQGHQAF